MKAWVQQYNEEGLARAARDLLIQVNPDIQVRLDRPDGERGADQFFLASFRNPRTGTRYWVAGDLDTDGPRVVIGQGVFTGNGDGFDQEYYDSVQDLGQVNNQYDTREMVLSAYTALLQFLKDSGAKQ